MRIAKALGAMMLMLGLLGACERSAGTSAPNTSPFLNTDITGIDYGRGFRLHDHNGKLRMLADFKGKAVLLFFGYTQCPDVCPTTMAELASVMKQLGPKAERLQVLFVTVDPERDTAALLSKYVPAFDPRFLGLVGTPAEIQKVASEFHVFYQKSPGKQPGTYTVDHTTGSYVFDPAGRIRLFIRHGQGAAPIAHDIQLLLDSA